MAKGFANTVAMITKQAHANATRCCMVWAALALREEGYGKARIKRVLENIYKYANTLNGKNTIDDQLKHIEDTVGLRIVWSDDNTITMDEVEEIERFYDGEEE